MLFFLSVIYALIFRKTRESFEIYSLSDLTTPVGFLWPTNAQVTPPVTPPAAPPVTPPVAPPVTPPVAPPVTPPVAPSANDGVDRQLVFEGSGLDCITTDLVCDKGGIWLKTDPTNYGDAMEKCDHEFIYQTHCSTDNNKKRCMQAHATNGCPVCDPFITYQVAHGPIFNNMVIDDTIFANITDGVTCMNKSTIDADCPVYFDTSVDKTTDYTHLPCLDDNYSLVKAPVVTTITSEGPPRPVSGEESAYTACDQTKSSGYTCILSDSASRCGAGTKSYGTVDQYDSARVCGSTSSDDPCVVMDECGECVYASSVYFNQTSSMEEDASSLETIRNKVEQGDKIVKLNRVRAVPCKENGQLVTDSDSFKESVNVYKKPRLIKNTDENTVTMHDSRLFALKVKLTTTDKSTNYNYKFRINKDNVEFPQLLTIGIEKVDDNTYWFDLEPVTSAVFLDGNQNAAIEVEMRVKSPHLYIDTNFAELDSNSYVMETVATEINLYTMMLDRLAVLGKDCSVDVTYSGSYSVNDDDDEWNIIDHTTTPCGKSANRHIRIEPYPGDQVCKYESTIYSASSNLTETKHTKACPIDAVCTRTETPCTIAGASYQCGTGTKSIRYTTHAAAQNGGNQCGNDSDPECTVNTDCDICGDDISVSFFYEDANGTESLDDIHEAQARANSRQTPCDAKVYYSYNTNNPNKKCVDRYSGDITTNTIPEALSDVTIPVDQTNCAKVCSFTDTRTKYYDVYYPTNKYDSVDDLSCDTLYYQEEKYPDTVPCMHSGALLTSVSQKVVSEDTERPKCDCKSIVLLNEEEPYYYFLIDMNGVIERRFECPYWFFSRVYTYLKTDRSLSDCIECAWPTSGPSNVISITLHELLSRMSIFDNNSDLTDMMNKIYSHCGGSFSRGVITSTTQAVLARGKRNTTAGCNTYNRNYDGEIYILEDNPFLITN